MYLSGVHCFGIGSFWMVLFVRNSILTSFLNRLVINVVSFANVCKECPYLCGHVCLSVCSSSRRSMVECSVFVGRETIV